MIHTERRALWLRWVAANALGELFGLGLTVAVFALVFTLTEARQDVGMILLAYLIAVFSGGIEATIVGLGQWWAMHPWFPSISRRAWWWGTLVGALVAYSLGFLPSTLMSLSAEATSQAPVAEPPQGVVLLLAAGMGLVSGAVLSFAQWWVIRSKVEGAGWWIPANMLAWMAGMPLIFWGIDAVQKLGSTFSMILLLAGVLLITGAVVGAVHGLFLVRLARRNYSPAV